MLTARRLLATLVGVGLALCATGSAYAAASKYGRAPGLDNPVLRPGDRAAYASGRVVVKFRHPLPLDGAAKASGTPEIDAIFTRHGVSSIERVSKKAQLPSKPGGVDLTRVYEIRYEDGADALAVATELAAHPDVEYAEPLFMYALDLVPNDTSYPTQVPYISTRMRFPLGWDVTTGAMGNVVIGICDGGTKYLHTDLNANTWNNADEIAGNLIDDDMNGFVDDIRGWNFANNSNDPTGLPATPASANHGTHVAGIACAVTNNALGIAGASFNAKYMPICVASPTNDNAIAFGYQGITYAADNDADVVNCSWGGTGSPSAFEQDVITYAYDNGTVVVAAAGNTGSEVDHFPSAYDHVLAVANLQNTDVRNTSTTYGVWVDVSAQGTSILSTINSGTNAYGTLTGTSMSSPFVAGLCGLVKTRYPGYLPEQVIQRVRVTSDNVDALQPVQYRGRIGYGRINAQQALIKNTPAVSVTSNTFTTTDGDGIIEPGETVTVNLEVTNWLAACTGLEFRLRDNSANITEVDSIATLPSLDSLASAALPPFTFTVAPATPIQHTVVFTVAISSTSPLYTDKSRFEMTVLPVFATHDRNNVDCSITSVGKLGYALTAGGTGKDGIGFRFNGSSSYLFEGGMMIGNSGASISNGARVDNVTQDNDFLTEPNGIPIVTEPSPPFDEYGVATFTDAAAEVPLGLWIRQESIEMADPPNDDFIVLKYLVRNQGAVARNGLHMGWYCDWDIDSGSYITNRTDYDAARGLMYAYNTTPGPGPDDYVGVMTLTSPGTTAARGIWNDQAQSPDWGVYDGYTDEEKYETISTPGATHPVTGPHDISIGLGTGPFDLDPGEEITIAFAFVGGTNLTDLQANADAAQAFYDGLATDVGDDEQVTAPRPLRLGQNAPNPFNPTTTIAFDMPREAHVKLRVFTVDGRLVRTLIDEVRPAGPNQQVVWDGRDDGGHMQASGTYLYRFSVEGGNTLVRKMQLLK
jgi:hypothetical protein